MKTSTKTMKVFIQEDDKEMQKKIARELKDYNYAISFFSKDDSAFDLLLFNPDILIQDYKTKKVVNCYEWAVPYNQWA
jgi:DNA-binding response OmpR family regulator